MPAQISRLRPFGAKARALDLKVIVEGLRFSRETAHNIRLGGRVTEVPSASVIAEVLDGIVTSLFPTHLDPRGLGEESVDLFVGNSLSTAFSRLTDQLVRGLRFDEFHLTNAAAQLRAEGIVHGFAHQLPAIRALLVSDLRAAQQRDRSSESLAEVLICHPSTRAIIHHRLAHALHGEGAHFVARIIAALAQTTTGIDIHPGARIAAGFVISKGMGVSIGETAVIGQNVCLHEGVTLGEADAPDATTATRRSPRHPIIEDNVVIREGARIIGRITVGAGSVIGGNIWLTHSVPPGSAVTQAVPAIIEIQSLD